VVEPSGDMVTSQMNGRAVLDIQLANRKRSRLLGIGVRPTKGLYDGIEGGQA